MGQWTALNCAALAAHIQEPDLLLGLCIHKKNVFVKKKQITFSLPDVNHMVREQASIWTIQANWFQASAKILVHNDME